MEDSSILIMNGYHKPHHRVLKPPGGETHDIFGTGSPSAYNEATEASRRARSANHQHQLQSNIFDPIPYTLVQANGKAKDKVGENGTGKATNGEEKNGGEGEEEELEEVALNSDEVDGKQQTEDKPEARRVVKDRMKSNVFGDWNETSNGHTPSPRRQSSGLGGGNPITGEGYANGFPTNNGELKDSSNRRGRYPPGGPSSNLW